MPMNTANKLTLARVFMIPLFLVIVYWGFPGSRYVALGVYILACLTDLLDGYVARHYNQVSDFGKFADPLADKCLVMAALCWFVETGDMVGWVLAVVLLREFAVSGMRLIAVEKGRVIAAGWSGKVRGVDQPHLRGGHRADHHLLRRGVFYEEPGHPRRGEMRKQGPSVSGWSLFLSQNEKRLSCRKGGGWTYSGLYRQRM